LKQLERKTSKYTATVTQLVLRTDSTETEGKIFKFAATIIQYELETDSTERVRRKNIKTYSHSQ
jgi:hypothetical protein